MSFGFQQNLNYKGTEGESDATSSTSLEQPGKWKENSQDWDLEIM
jgi:hypothetical protein